MGKVGYDNDADVEVIPLGSSSNNSQSIQSEKFVNPLKMMNRSNYISDPTIVPRVQKYLELNDDKTYVNIDVMADELQSKYSEYARRKRSAFRGAVKRAYNIVMQSYASQSSEEEEISEESGEDSNNSLNNQLMEMYSRNVPKQNIGENELIDISSDDDDEVPQVEVHQMKSTNGPTSVQKNQNANLPAGNKLLASIPEKSVTPAMSVSIDRGKKRKLDSQTFNVNKKKKSYGSIQETTVNFNDLAGVDKVLSEIYDLIMHIKNPNMFRLNGIKPPRGFLLYGPPGCGKTLLVHALAGELNIPLINISAPEIIGGISGESEERIREIFEKALTSSPCILFIEEIDTICQNRQFAQKDMERRIVAQLLTCMDDLGKNENGDQVVVIGSTSRVDALDPALRRAGRFNREISIGMPDKTDRLAILKLLSKKLKLSEDVNLLTLAENTPGYVADDLNGLLGAAFIAAGKRTFKELQDKKRLELAIAEEKIRQEVEDKNEVNSTKEEQEIVIDGDSKDDQKSDSKEEANDGSIVVIDDESKHGDKVSSSSQPSGFAPIQSSTVKLFSESWKIWDDIRLRYQNVLSDEQLKSMVINMDDFQEALKRIQPSAKREGFATVPDVTWDDIGSLADIREELQMDILVPVKLSEQCKSLGISSSGILLCGPPGCGKTLLAKAVANEAGINFISVKGPELLNMYVGESERAVRTCFARARNSAPCVIFFDELDALCPRRTDSGEGNAISRVVNAMLTEMDGVQGRENVYLLAASNRPDMIDPAVLREGRLGKILYVGLPSASGRVEILKALTKNGRKPLLAPDVDLEAIGTSEQCSGYTGADLAALVRQASRFALRDLMKESVTDKACLVTAKHFIRAALTVKPSVSEKELKLYEELKKMYSVVKTDDEVEEMEYS